MAYKFPYELTQISSQTASSSGSISFTSVITSNYTEYYLSMRDIIPATDNVSLLMTLSINNGSTYLTSAYISVSHEITSAAANNANAGASSSILIASKLSSTTSRGFSGDFQLIDFNAAVIPSVKGFGCHYNKDATFSFIQQTGQNTGTTAITAFKMAMSSGNIASGTFILYGATY